MPPSNLPGEINTPQTVSDVRSAVAAGKAAVNDVKPLISSLKSGYKTTEFWLHLAVQVMAIAAVVLPDSSSVKALATLMSASSASVYSIGRVLLKK